MPVAKTMKMTKEYGKPKLWRRQSSNKENDDKQAMTQGGPNLSEPGDGDDGERGGERW